MQRKIKRRETHALPLFVGLRRAARAAFMAVAACSGGSSTSPQQPATAPAQPNAGSPVSAAAGTSAGVPNPAAAVGGRGSGASAGLPAAGMSGAQVAGGDRGSASVAGGSSANAGAEDAGLAADPDVGAASDAGAPPRTMQSIDPPVPDDCIKDVSPGDHTFTCSGLTFLALIDPMCTKLACGVIFDIHGATMSGAQMRDNTLLYKLAPSKGYVVVNPSATSANTGGSWDTTNDPPKIADFLKRTIKAFHVDPDRVHVTGFSQGSDITFWFLCNEHELLASAAPVSGASNAAMCLNDGWRPRVPILYENGTKDLASTIDRSRSMVDIIVGQLMLTGGMQIAGDSGYFRKHWVGDGGMEFDYIEHMYGGQAVLDGHCIPGGVDTPTTGTNNFALNATTCTSGMIDIKWGELALQWFIDHPRRH